MCAAVISHSPTSDLKLFLIPTDVPGAEVLVEFDAPLVANQGASAIALRRQDGLTVTISGALNLPRTLFSTAAYATSPDGNLRALLLVTSTPAQTGVFFSSCGPMVLKFNGGTTQSVFTTGLGGVPCLAASSDHTCPTTSNAFKIIVNDGGTEATVCINGWESGDGVPGSGPFTRRLSVSSSDDSFDRDELEYTCSFGSATNLVTGLAKSFSCTATSGDTKLIFAECETLCLGTAVECAPTRKRAPPVTATSALAFLLAAGAGGDPHLVSAEGLKFIFNGIANAVYALFTSPVVDINMQLAATGPTERYMTEMGIVFRGKNVTITPWFGKRKSELTEFFESLGATVEFHGPSMTVEFCNDHVATFAAMHTLHGAKINYLDVAISVPGCHDAYGGAL
ncbi:MAG: hypothetical protein IV100_15845, partial [Myxococcales bacterium]|nr:hypothetical protein [Myxococcales bacterium]